MARVPTGLLKLVAEAVVAGMDKSVLNDLAVIVHPDQAADIWQRWLRQSDEAQRRDEIQLLARTSREQVEPVVEKLISDIAPAHPEVTKAASAYLLNVPSAIRRCLRRPADPEGVTLAPSIPLRQAADLLALLPPHTAWFTPGDRPADIGDWELTELMDSNGLGETWLARNPRVTAVPPVFLKFCLHPAAKEKLARPDTLAAGSLLDRVLQQAQRPGILQLKRVHLNTDPPCLEYEFFAGGTLASLVRDWHADGQAPAPGVVARLVQQLAQTLGELHQLEPPLVHRGLNPSAVLVCQTDDGRFESKVLDLGLSEFLPRPSHDEWRRSPARRTDAATGAVPDIDPYLHKSPQELRGEPPQPRDDVFALGILWYQMLTGNLAAGRPGGSQWRRRLSEQGMAPELIELLEACLEDDPFYRPADAADLADKLDRLLSKEKRPPQKSNPLDELLSSSPRTQHAAQLPEEGSGESRPGGRVRQRRSDVWQLFETLEEKAPELTKLQTNSLGMRLVLVPAGVFLMGSPTAEFGARENEWPQREVALTRAYYVAVTPVTQQQFLLVMGHNPARFNADNGGSPDHPVETVTWEQATEFCRRLSEQPDEKKSGRVYRLPTEAEWEYACRAGTTTSFCFGADLSSAQANFDGNFPCGNAPKGRWLQKTARVGQYPANSFGIHDLHGNVWEWCADWLDGTYYAWGPKRDPKGPGEGRYRVLRGGSWKNHAVTCRAGYRNGLNPRLKDNATGFRVVCDAS